MIISEFSKAVFGLVQRLRRRQVFALVEVGKIRVEDFFCASFFAVLMLTITKQNCLTLSKSETILRKVLETNEMGACERGALLNN